MAMEGWRAGIIILLLSIVPAGALQQRPIQTTLYRSVLKVYSFPFALAATRRRDSRIRNTRTKKSREEEESLNLPRLEWPIDDPNHRPVSPAEESIQEVDRIRRFLELRSARGKTTFIDDDDSSTVTNAGAKTGWEASVQAGSKPSAPSSTSPRPRKASDKKQQKPTPKRKSERRKSPPPKTLTRYTGSMIRTDLPYELTLQALRTYHQEESHLVMPRTFVVPAPEEEVVSSATEISLNVTSKRYAYPVEWHGADLAGTVYDMKWWTRYIKHRPDRVADLNQLGFIWERLQPEWNLVLEALVTYGIMNGNLLVPAKFVIPHNDTNYPRATWGIPLGNRVYRIRDRNDFLHGDTAVSRRNQLDSLGFCWDVREHYFQIFCQALELYAKNEIPEDLDHNTNVRNPSKAHFRGALRIPAKFVVPENSPVWPKELWGYPLLSLIHI